MRRAIFAVAVLLISAIPAFAVTRTVMVVDDVIKMSKAGVSDDDIIAFVKKTADPFEINGDDVIAMNDAHVSSAVIKVVIDESSARMKDERRDDTTTTRREVVYVSPGIYDPYDYGYYDPFWYGPRAFVGFGFGFGGYYGGHHGGFHGRHFRHR